MHKVGVHPITPLIGAEIRGVNLAEPIGVQAVEEIRQALRDHVVLVFRDQPIGPERQLAFGEHFGSVAPKYGGFASHPDFPSLQVVQNNAKRNDYNNVWHMDSTYLRSPPAFTLLHCVSTPAVGGDTLFSSLYAAYDALPEPVKVLVAGLSATHDFGLAHLPTVHEAPENMEKLIRARVERPPMEHPLVYTHPATGRKALFLEGSYSVAIKGMPWDLGGDILRWLQKHTLNIEFQMRVRWEPNTVVIFDNRVCQHYASIDFLLATPSPTVERRMHRLTLNAHPNM